MGRGPGDAPPRGKEGETKFGFTIGQWVEVIKDSHFKGWQGTVLAFGDTFVAVDLWRPTYKGQWFRPKNLKAIPKPKPARI